MTTSASNVARSLVLCLPFFTAAVASAQQAGQMQPQWDQQTASAMAMLQRTAVRRGNDFYVQFTLQSTGAQSQQQGGFAPALTPRAAEQPLAQGLMRIMTGGPSSSPGYVYVRVYQYSIYQQGKWSRPKALMLHMWEWKSSNGGPALRSTTDEINGTSDGGITEFVASVFNVKPNQVICRKPQVIPPLPPGSN
jgi:hypothetical protein